MILLLAAGSFDNITLLRILKKNFLKGKQAIIGKPHSLPATAKRGSIYKKGMNSYETYFISCRTDGMTTPLQSFDDKVEFTF